MSGGGASGAWVKADQAGVYVVAEGKATRV